MDFYHGFLLLNLLTNTVTYNPCTMQLVSIPLIKSYKEIVKYKDERKTVKIL